MESGWMDGSPLMEEQRCVQVEGRRVLLWLLRKRTGLSRACGAESRTNVAKLDSPTQRTRTTSYSRSLYSSHMARARPDATNLREYSFTSSPYTVLLLTSTMTKSLPTVPNLLYSDRTNHPRGQAALHPRQPIVAARNAFGKTTAKSAQRALILVPSISFGRQFRGSDEHVYIYSW